jgi:hypothetical protein
MASQDDPQRVLSGSINLLPPGDQIPQGDALVLEGFRVDQDGMLRTRRGFNAESGLISGGTIHTLARSGNDRYVGIGNTLYWGSPVPLTTAISSAFDGKAIDICFYQGQGWAMNANPNAQLRLGPAAAGSAGPPAPPTGWNWGIAPPATAPTGSVVGAVTSVLNQYDAANLFSYAGYWVQGTSPLQFNNLLTDGAVTSPPQPGVTGFTDGQSSMLFGYNPTANPGFTPPAVSFISAVEAPWEVVTEYAPGFDSSFAGLAANGDAFHFWMYFDDPSTVDSIYIQLYSDQDTMGSNAPMVAANFQNSDLNQALQSISVFHILRAIDINPYDLPQDANANGTAPDPAALQALIASLGTPHFMEYLGGQQYTSFAAGFQQTPVNGYPTWDEGGIPVNGTFDWTNITGLVITVVLNAPTTWGLNECTVTQGIAAGQWNGSITFYVSFANDQDQDSNPTLDQNGNLVGVTVNAANQNITLNGIPISPDPQVTQRWIYAVGGGLSEPLRVAIIPDNVTTTWSAFDSVATAQNNFVEMPVNRTWPPPPAHGLLTSPFLGYLIAFNIAASSGSPAYPARYAWTPTAQPWFFPGWDEESGNWEDLGADEDPVQAATYHKQMVVFYKLKSIWRLVGSPDTNDAVQADATFGAVGPAAVVNAGAYDFFVGAEGIYRFDGDYATKVSAQLDPLFKGDQVFINADENWVPIDPNYITTCVLGLINDRLYFSYPSLGSTVPNNLLVMHVPTGRWSSVSRGGRYVTAMNYEGAGNFLLVGETTPSGAIVETAERYTTGDSDGGVFTAMAVEWQSRYLDQGLPNNYKRYSDLAFDFQTAVGSETPSTLTVSICDENGNITALGTISSATRTTCTPFNLGDLRGKRCSIRVTGNVTSTCIIYGAYLWWYPEERVATTFDSGFADKEQVSQCDYVELAATGSGQAGTLTLYSDLPGSLLAEQETPAIVIPNGRGNVRQRLSSILEGRNLRFRASSGSPFQLHAIRIRQRVVGEYIDGTIGEYWESPEFSVAPGRVGELKDLLLDYDAEDGGTLEIYSDLPGNALSVVRALAIPVRATRAPFVFAFEDSSDTLPYGQLFKARVIPPPTGVIRLHGRATLRARLIGTFFDGSAGEIWETQQLDMIGGTGLFREVALVAQCGGPMILQVQMDLPEEDVHTVSSFQFDTTAQTTGREPIYFRLPGTTKGRLQKFRLIGPNWARLFEVKVYARGLGNTSSGWSWLNVPLAPTADEFSEIQLPVRATPEAFTWIDLPVDAIG